MKNAIQTLLTIVVIIVAVVYCYVHRSQFVILKNIQLLDMITLSILTVLFFYATGFTFKLLVSLMQVHLSHTETVGLSILTNFGNYLGPIRPGAALKAVYLKSSRGLAYTKFTSVLIANSFLVLFMSGGIGIVLLLLLIRKDTSVPMLLFFICGGLMIGSTLPFAYKTPRIKIRGRITNLFDSVLEGFALIRFQKGKLAMICISVIVQFFLAAFINQTVFRSIGTSITFLSALSIGVFTTIANFFTVTPNNLGIQETVIAYIFSMTGFDFATGVVGASISRVVHMILTFSMTPIFSYLLFKNQNLSLKNALRKKAGT